MKSKGIYLTCIGQGSIVGGTAISWNFIKQTLVATSLNHAEILAIYEAHVHGLVSLLSIFEELVDFVCH